MQHEYVYTSCGTHKTNMVGSSVVRPGSSEGKPREEGEDGWEGKRKKSTQQPADTLKRAPTVSSPKETTCRHLRASNLVLCSSSAPPDGKIKLKRITLPHEPCANATLL